jgi:hypothetical protein
MTHQKQDGDLPPDPRVTGPDRVTKQNP